MRDWAAVAAAEQVVGPVGGYHRLYLIQSKHQCAKSSIIRFQQIPSGVPEMATEADIPAAVCETIKEQGGKIVVDATNIAINKIPQEEKTQADTLNEPPTVVGDKFLETPSIGKVHCEVSNISADASMLAEKPYQTANDDTEILLLSKPKLGDQPLEIAGSEETSSERIQHDADESNDSEKGEDRGVLPVDYSTYSGELASGMQAGDIPHDPDLDDLRVETQLSKDTTSDYHCVNDSLTEQMTLSKENSQEAILPGAAKEFTIQAEATNDANGDGEKTEVDIPLNLTSDVSKEECPNDQNKMNSEQEGSDNEINFAENSDKIAEKVGQENSTLADATSSSDEPLSKNESNSSFSQEDDTAVTTPEGSGILLENIVDESQGAVESQSRNLEDFVTNHGNTNITEKTEECSLVRVDGSQIKCDDQLEKESKQLPMPEVLTGGTNDNESAVVDKVKDEDEDLEEAGMYAIEKNKIINQQKEEVQVEKPVESLHVAPENIEASNLGQDNKTSFQEEHSTDADQQGVMSDNSEEKTIDTVDTKKEILENFSTIISIPPTEGSVDANLQEIASDSTDKKMVDELDTQKEVLENCSTIVSNEDIEENLIVKGDDSEMKNEEHLEKESIKPSSPIPLERKANDHESFVAQETPIEDGEKAELCENEASIENMKIEFKIEKPENSLDVTSENIKASDSGQEIETRDSAEEESVAANPQGILDVKTDKEKVGAAEIKEEIPRVQSFPTNVSITPEGSINANLQNVTSDSTVEKMIDELDTQKEVLENFSTIVSNEEIEENSTVKLDDSEMKNEERLEKESIKTSSPIHLASEANDDESTVAQETPIDNGEKAELCEDETNIETMKIELLIEKPENSLDVTSENIKASDSGQEVKTRVSAEEEGLAANPQGILDEKTDKEIIYAAEIKEETPESFSTIVSTPPEEESLDADLQTATNDSTAQKVIDELDSQKEVPENFSTIVSNEDIKENLIVKVDDSEMKNEEHLEKEGMKTSSPIPLAREANDDESTAEQETPIEDGEKAETCENETSTENTKIEFKIEKQENSSDVTFENIKASDSGQEVEPGVSAEEEGLAANPQGIGDEKTDKEIVDAAEIKEETPESFSKIVSTPPEEGSLDADLQTATNDSTAQKVIDELDTQKEVPENFSTIVSNEDIEENLIVKVDDSEMKYEEHLEKESIKTSSPIPLAREDDEPTVEQETPIEDGEKAELCENETSTESMKIELKIEKPQNSLDVTSENTKASDLGLEVETRVSAEEDGLAANTQGILDEKTDKEIVGAAEIKEETPESFSTIVSTPSEEGSIDANLQKATSDSTAEKMTDDLDKQKEVLENFSTIVSDEDIKENMIVEVDHSEMKNEDHLEKESIKTSSPIHVAWEASNDGSSVEQETQIEDGEKADLCGNETSTETMRIESKIQKPENSSDVTSENIKASDSGQEIETTVSVEEESLAANPQGILDENTDKEKVGAAEIKEETPEVQNFASIVSNEKTYESKLIQDDGSQKEEEEHLEKEGEKPSSITDFTGNANDDELTVMDDVKIEDENPRPELSEKEKNIENALLREEVQIEKPAESSNAAIEEIQVSEVGQHTEKTGFIEEKEDVQDASEVCKASASSETIETTCYLEEQSLTTNLQAITSNKEIDATDAEEVTLENVAKPLSYEQAEENSTVQMDCPDMEHEEHLERASEIPPLVEVPTQETDEYKSKNIHDEDQIKCELSEKDTVSTSVKEEANIEKPLDSLQVTTKDIEATDLGQDIEIDSTKEQIRTADPQEMSGDKTEEKTTNAADTEEETTEVQDIASNFPNGDNEEDSPIKDTGSQKPFLKEESMGNLNDDDDSIIIHETKFEDESSIKTDLSKNEQNLDFTLAKEEISSESSQAAEEIKASASSQERETSSLEEQSLTANPQEIMGDYKEDEINHVIGMKEETPEDKTVASTLPYEDIEKSSLIQADCSQKEQTEHLEKKSDDPSGEQASTADTTGSPLVEEELGEKCIDSLQAATQEIKASGSGQDIETSSTGEQILTTDQQETSNDKIEEKTIDAAYRNEETLEVQDIATNAPSGETDENSPTETDGPQKPFPKEASRSNANGDESTILQEAKFEDEVLSEHEKNTDSSVNKEVHTESIRVAVLPEDIKASALVQDRETSSLEEQNLTPNPQGIIGDQKEGKTIDATDLKEETPEDMNIAATIPKKDTGDSSQIQVDYSEMESEEHLVKESENPSLTEALEKDTEESGSVNEAEEEKLIDSLEVVSKNIKASASNQDAEISSIKEQILTEDPQEISGYKTEEKSIDATAMNEEVLKIQDLATNVPGGDSKVNSTIEVDGSQKPSIGEASTGNANDDESKEAGASSEVKDKELEPDTELPKETENADIKAKTIEFNEEEGYLKDLQKATAVNIAAHEEVDSDSIAVKTPCTKSFDANEVMVVDIAEDPNYKQEESSITKKIDEHLLISHENVTNVTGLVSEAPKLIGDCEVAAEAYSCDDKTDTEKAGELYDGSIIITTNENPEETDKKESTDTETQAAKGEEEAELIQEDPAARTDQQDIEEDLPTKASQDVSEPNEVNAEEEKRNSDNCKEISGSTTDVALEDVSSSNVASEEISTYNPFQESRREIQQEAENEEETSEVDHSTTERELTMVDTEGSHVGKAASDDNEETKTDTINEEEEASKHKVSDFSSAAPEETSTGKILGEANIFYDTTNTTQSTVEDILVNNRSIGDLKEKSDDEAPKTIEMTPTTTGGQELESTTIGEISNLISQSEGGEYEHAPSGSAPTTTEGQELESTTVGEISNLISQGEGGEYEHAPSGSVTEEKLDSNEVELGHGENRGGYEPKHEVLESIAQVQNCDIVSKAEETRTCEENREATEIKRSDKVVAEDRFESKETINIDISSKKIKEDDEDVEDSLGSLKEEVITESHLQDEINTEETFDVIRKTNETEKVSKVLEEPDDKAIEKPKEKIVANESIDRSLLGKSIEEVATILDSEEADGIDHIYIKKGTEDSRKEENMMLSARESKEESQTCIEVGRLGFSSDSKDTSEVSRSDGDQDIPEDNGNSTTKNEYSEEKYPNKSVESQMSAVSNDIELIEQVSKATKITLEMQGTRTASDSDAEPEATGVDSQQVEEGSHKCKGMAETSMSVEPTEISTSKIIQEYTVETSLESEDNLAKLHDFPQESHVMDSEVKMAQKDGSIDLQIVRDITDQDVQELNEASIAMINKEKPMEADPNENIEIRRSDEGKEADSIQKAQVLETLTKEIAEQQPGRTSEGVSKAERLDCRETKTIAHECNDMLENSSSAVIETVSESIIHHSSAGDTAQTDKNHEGQMQIDVRPVLPHTTCSDTETAEKDLPVNFAGRCGTDEKELEVTPLPAKDKHVVLEADHTKNVNPETSIGNKDTSVTEHGDSAERSQGEGETLKPSELEQDAANCGHEEMPKSRDNSESKEIDKQSLADLLQVSIKETSKMADHSAIDKEPTRHKDDLQAEKTDEAEHEDTKTDEEKDDEEESSEQKRADVCSEAPVMVDARDADAKVAHKKSHNILSGVGSKMKHSIAKVKKAITGKSSHSHPKPPSPK
ncbi:hypothetical protein Salat_2193100 [Sesamum alatum]|uniref:Uncharacterized protein n=1 Tax=Sesamum alatum TaxID=300844 RepID=A0AAE1XTN1_9LAMI|nr:hypothetical protein Salat_2193100 [Sesamum alatum]